MIGLGSDKKEFTFCFNDRIATRMRTLETRVRKKIVERTASFVVCSGVDSGQHCRLAFSLIFILSGIWKKIE